MRRVPLAVAVFVAAAALNPSVWASPAFESLSRWSGVKIEAQKFSISGKAPLNSAPSFAAGRPARGTFTGSVNRSPIKLTFDRRAWTLKGGMNHSPVDIHIDHDNGRITGGANGSPVDLTFRWTPESMSLEGGANHSPVKLVIDFKKGLVWGHSNHSPIKVEYDEEKGTFKGYAGHAPVDLSYDKKTGRLTGGMNRAPVDMVLTNINVGDFLQFFFLFVR